MAKVEIPDYPGNTNESKMEALATEKVDVSSLDSGDKIEIIEKKEIKQIANPVEHKKGSIVGETLKTTGSYLLTDILWPAIKDTIVEMVKSGIEMIAYGESRPARGIRRKGTRSYYDYSASYRYPDRPSYRDRYDDEPPFDRSESEYRANSPYRFRNYVIRDRREAEMILEQMGDLMEEYGVVTVNDLYEMMGVDTVYTDVNFGWVSLENFREGCIKQVRGGYILNFPKPKEIQF